MIFEESAERLVHETVRLLSWENAKTLPSEFSVKVEFTLPVEYYRLKQHYPASFYHFLQPKQFPTVVVKMRALPQTGFPI
jgi:hypothetical protein